MRDPIYDEAVWAGMYADPKWIANRGTRRVFVTPVGLSRLDEYRNKYGSPESVVPSGKCDVTATFRPAIVDGALTSGTVSVTVTVDADTFVRYEDAGIAAQPRVFENYEGMAGKSVLMGEESLTEWVVDVPESGLYDLTLLYYPYAGKNSAIQRAFFVDGKLPYSELAMVDFSLFSRE